MEKLDHLGWVVGMSGECHGLRVGIRSNDPSVLNRVREILPPGWLSLQTDEVDLLYSFRSAESTTRAGLRSFHLVYCGTLQVMRTLAFEDALYGLENDLLLRVVDGGYYGHPNPARCEWVLNGGNPTAGADPGEVSAYPVPTAADPNWRGAVHDFGNNKSPNGALEYRSDVFGGSLRGHLLVARYANGNDVVALEPGPDGAIAGAITGIPGLTDLGDPLDLTENPATGDLYLAAGVSSTSSGRLVLLRATPGA